VKGTDVSGANATVLLGMTSVNSGVELIRGNDPVSIDGSTSNIKKLSIYTPPKSSPGHGRYHGNGALVASATLVDKRVVLLSVTTGGVLTPLIATKGSATSVVQSATYKSFGPPCVGGGGLFFAALASLNKGGDVSSGNDAAIVANIFANSSFDDIAVENGNAPDVANATFATFSDPVSNDQGRYAFFATMKGVSSATKGGLWYGTAGALHLQARTGSPAPDAIGNDGTGTFAAFTNLALPGGANSGPIFLAKVKGTGVSGKNSSGLWGVDTTGFTRQLLRAGDVFDGRVVKKFVVLNSVAGAYSASRTFNATGGVVALVSFTDKTQALVYVGIP
jgi:hypothetical protein